VNNLTSSGPTIYQYNDNPYSYDSDSESELAGSEIVDDHASDSEECEGRGIYHSLNENPSTSSSDEDSSSDEELFPFTNKCAYNPPKNFDKKNKLKYEIDKLIAGGNFKNVYSGILKDVSESKNVVILAPKSPIDTPAKERARYYETKIAEVFLEDQENSKKYFPKVYAINNSFIFLKYANCGEAKKALPKMSYSERLKIVQKISKAVEFLHKKGIIHNDIALRNILIHVGKDNSIKAYLADNGSCIFKGELLKFLSRANDISAPEWKNISNEKTDAFSFGQLLVDAFLRPEEEEDIDYIIKMQLRIKEREKTSLELLSKDSLSKDQIPSAIEDQDYLELKGISVELAELAKNLLSYEPLNRQAFPDISKTLESITV
jgi:serine/threonine protein kinase